MRLRYVHTLSTLIYLFIHYILLFHFSFLIYSWLDCAMLINLLLGGNLTHIKILWKILLGWDAAKIYIYSLVSTVN